MRYELHYALTKVSATVHRAGCAHGRPRTTRVTELAGETLEYAMMDPEVMDLEERGYAVKAAPCAKARG